MIKFYKTNEEWGFLNNFKKARMFIFGRWTNNVEIPYQASKCIDPIEAEMIWNLKTPREAQELGQKVKMRSDWDQVKDRVMFDCCMAKFLQHPDLRAKLMATGDEEIVEQSPIDSYWGEGPDGKGQNRLGKTLMRIRDELKGE